MGNGPWQIVKVFPISHCPFAIQDAFVSILLGLHALMRRPLAARRDAGATRVLSAREAWAFRGRRDARAYGRQERGRTVGLEADRSSLSKGRHPEYPAFTFGFHCCRPGGFSFLERFGFREVAAPAHRAADPFQLWFGAEDRFVVVAGEGMGR
jgi:hypothetical protein